MGPMPRHHVLRRNNNLAWCRCFNLRLALVRFNETCHANELATIGLFRVAGEVGTIPAPDHDRELMVGIGLTKIQEGRLTLGFGCVGGAGHRTLDTLLCSDILACFIP